MKPSLAWEIRARIGLRDIADEPVDGSPRLRASAAILYFVVCVITDGGRLERGKRSYGFSEMVRKTGFDPVTPCTPSTCSAWLSYFLNKMARRKTRRRASCRTRGFCLVTLTQRLERTWRSSASPKWSQRRDSIPATYRF